MTETTKCDWAVYDLETNEVVGVWKDYADALMVWEEICGSVDTIWALFPADEISAENLEKASALGEV